MLCLEGSLREHTRGWPYMYHMCMYEKMTTYQKKKAKDTIMNKEPYHAYVGIKGCEKYD